MADTKTLVERLREKELKSRDVIKNCEAVLEALQGQMERFEKRDLDAPWNTYAVRLAADHQSSVRTETKLADALAEAASAIASQEARIAELEGALRDTPCPRPCNNSPDDFTVGQCVAAGECGCSTGAALHTEEKNNG